MLPIVNGQGRDPFGLDLDFPGMVYTDVTPPGNTHEMSGKEDETWYAHCHWVYHG